MSKLKMYLFATHKTAEGWADPEPIEGESANEHNARCTAANATGETIYHGWTAQQIEEMAEWSLTGAERHHLAVSYSDDGIRMIETVRYMRKKEENAIPCIPPEPTAFLTYAEYAMACVQFAEPFHPVHAFARAFWPFLPNYLTGPTWPDTWTDKPGDNPAPKVKGTRGRKVRDGAWGEIGLVSLMRDYGHWSWVQIRNRANYISGKPRSWTRYRQIYIDGMKRTGANTGKVFEAFRSQSQCGITDDQTTEICSELGIKPPKFVPKPMKEITQ